MYDWGSLEQIGTFWLISEWTIRIAALFVVPRNRKPSSGTAWLLLIFLFPLVGLITFLIIGSPRLPKGRRQAQKNLNVAISKLLKQFQKGPNNAKLLNAAPPVEYQSIASLSEALGRMPVFDGNKIESIPEYNDVITKIAKDIDEAKNFVHLEYFIIVQDEITQPIFDAMGRAVKRGVTVRVLYDSHSTKRYKGSRKMIKNMKEMGVDSRPMLPLRLPGRGYVRPDLRNHRKLVVVDSTIAYTGSLNLVKRNYHRKDSLYYDELVVRMRGPIALQFAAVFVSDWYSETGVMISENKAGEIMKNITSYGSTKAQVLPSGPGYEYENNLKLFTALIHNAKERIVITNPYFVPDDALTNAITSASRRGVEVIMINSEVMDQWMVGHAQRSFYEGLLAAGVNIHLYHAPILLHSKFMTIDGKIAAVGSSNLDIRSFVLDLEVTLIIYDEAVVRDLNNVEKMYLKKSTKLTLEQWRKRSHKHNLLDNIARLTSALQ